MENLADILGEMVLPRRMERILSVLDSRLANVRVVALNLHNPHNMAAVVRSSEAFGVQHLHVVEEFSPYKFSRRVTKGCQKWLSLHRHDNFAQCAGELRNMGYSLYAATLGEGAVPVAKVPVDKPVALIFGNESKGVSEEALSLCDGSFIIPMSGFSQSLNVSVAAAVSLYDVATRMKEAHPDTAYLPPEEKTALLAEWLPKSAPFAKRITKVFNRLRKP